MRAVEDGGGEAARHVGQLHAVHAAAVVVVEGEHLGQLGGPALRVEHRDVGAREHEVLDRLAVDGLPVAELALLDEAEELAEDQRLGGVASAAPGYRSGRPAGVPTGSSRCAGSRPGRAGRRASAPARSRGGRGRGRTSGRPARRSRRRPSGRRAGCPRRWPPPCGCPGPAPRGSRASLRRGRWRGRRARGRRGPWSACRCLRRARGRCCGWSPTIHCTASAGYVGRPRS